MRTLNFLFFNFSLLSVQPKKIKQKEKSWLCFFRENKHDFLLRKFAIKSARTFKKKVPLEIRTMFKKHKENFSFLFLKNIQIRKKFFFSIGFLFKQPLVKTEFKIFVCFLIENIASDHRALRLSKFKDTDYFGFSYLSYLDIEPLVLRIQFEFKNILALINLKFVRTVQTNSYTNFKLKCNARFKAFSNFNGL